MAAFSEPTGKYGRCGSIISLAFAATTIEPLPNGQTPAMARNKVDLPAPDGPVTRVRSLLRMLKPSAETNGLPLGNLTRSCSRSILSLPGDVTTWIESALLVSVAALPIAISNPSRRATHDRHSPNDQ